MQELVSQLASVSTNEQKQILGEKLYPLIQETHPGKQHEILNFKNAEIETTFS